MVQKNCLFKGPTVLEKIDVSKTKLVLGKDIEEAPLVSIVMPVYNHPDYLKESVLSAVSQDTDIPYEIIVVDNNHPELQSVNQNIIASIDSRKIKYYVNAENIRFSGNCNMGIALARGKFVMFCHDDDLLMPDAISKVLYVKRITKDKFPDAAIFGNTLAIDENGNSLPYNDEWKSWLYSNRTKYYPVKLVDFLQKNYTNGCGSLYNRDRLIEVGGFCQEYSPCTDYVLNTNYTACFGSFAIRDHTFKYRITEQSDTGNVFFKLAGMHGVIKNEIINYLGLPNFYRRYITIHDKVFNYHVYSKWSNEKQSKTKVLIYRFINKIINCCFTISRALRSK